MHKEVTVNNVTVIITEFRPKTSKAKPTSPANLDLDAGLTTSSCSSGLASTPGNDLTSDHSHSDWFIFNNCSLMKTCVYDFIFYYLTATQHSVFFCVFFQLTIETTILLIGLMFVLCQDTEITNLLKIFHVRTDSASQTWKLNGNTFLATPLSDVWMKCYLIGKHRRSFKGHLFEILPCTFTYWIESSPLPWWVIFILLKWTGMKTDWLNKSMFICTGDLDNSETTTLKSTDQEETDNSKGKGKKKMVG